ncbi:MAG: NifB/NifX family molybdenum-iron cluster-binding protein [Candidatus Bipolaricaulota bacterium]
MKPLVACGTKDGERLYSEHFGESPYFQLYKLNSTGYELVEEVENISKKEDEDEHHGDPAKAKSISSLLKTRSVNTLLAHQMGPNIIKVKKNFVPVISREVEIEKAIQLVLDKLHLVEREWRKGDKREHLVIG